MKMSKITHRRCETWITPCKRSAARGTKHTHNLELRSSSTPTELGAAGAFTLRCTPFAQGYLYLPPSEVLEISNITHRRCVIAVLNCHPELDSGQQTRKLITLCERSVTQGTKRTHNLELRSSSTPPSEVLPPSPAERGRGRGLSSTGRCPVLGYFGLSALPLAMFKVRHRKSEIGQH